MILKLVLEIGRCPVGDEVSVWVFFVHFIAEKMVGK
jgi:hypothetical protein